MIKRRKQQLKLGFNKMSIVVFHQYTFSQGSNCRFVLGVCAAREVIAGLCNVYVRSGK